MKVEIGHRGILSDEFTDVKYIDGRFDKAIQISYDRDRKHKNDRDNS